MAPSIHFPSGPTGWAVVSACLLLAACGGRAPPPAADGASSLTVTVTQPVTREIDRSITVSGAVAAWQEMTLGVELTGIRVAEVLVEPGDRVRAGQPLLRLDARTLEVQARQAEAALAQARANLELARSELARGNALIERRLISTADFDQLQASLARAEAQLAAAEADRDAARLRLGFATLNAPHAGLISTRSVQPGQVVSAGATLLSLIRDGRLEWRAELADRDLVRVATGTTVEVTGPDGEIVRGSVRAVSPALDPQTRTAVLYADLPEPGPLRAGMFAEGRIQLGSSSTTVLPRESIVYRDGFPYVFVIEAPGDKDAPAGLARVAQRRVRTGSQAGEMVEVVEGLAGADRVVVHGAGFLSNGDLVQITAGSGKAS